MVLFSGGRTPKSPAKNSKYVSYHVHVYSEKALFLFFSLNYFLLFSRSLVSIFPLTRTWTCDTCMYYVDALREDEGNSPYYS